MVGDEDAEPAFRRAQQGDFVGVDAHLASQGSAEGPWRLALRALYAMTFPGRLDAMPTPADIARHQGHAGAVEAQRQRDLLSVLRLNPPHGSAGDAEDPGDAGGGWAEATLARAFRGWLEAEYTVAEHLAEAAADAAKATGNAAVRVDAEAVMALSAAAADVATSRARRASRMARAEALLQQEYLANLILARVRRHNGRAHLSVRILGSLTQVVPEVWQPWVGLELALAGGASLPRGQAPLSGLVDAARAGDRAGFTEAATRIRETVAACAPIAGEVAAYLAMIDIGAALPDDVFPWAMGMSPDAPHGIRDVREGGTRGTWVSVSPGRPARRILGTGIGLLADAVVIRSSRRGTRTEESVARLALEPDGMDERAFFEAVYGFPFAVGEHEEVLRGLLHRMRGAVAEAAEITRDPSAASGETSGEILRLVPRRTFVVEDPRCQEPLADRVLDRLAASNGRATAKELTAALRVPLRTVQRSLGQLVDDGACHAEPDGRRTEYVVEDTTFSEPSLHRLRGQRD